MWIQLKRKKPKLNQLVLYRTTSEKVGQARYNPEDELWKEVLLWKAV